jgi:hypothetical protein
MSIWTLSANLIVKNKHFISINRKFLVRNATNLRDPTDDQAFKVASKNFESVDDLFERDRLHHEGSQANTQNATYFVLGVSRIAYLSISRLAVIKVRSIIAILYETIIIFSFF